jgi:hypothetical protein
MQIWVDIVQADVPLLLGLESTSRHGFNVLIATDELFSAVHGWTMPLRRAQGHCLNGLRLSTLAGIRGYSC